MNREKRFRDILTHAWGYSPLYREIYSSAGIQEVDLKYIQLEDLPVVTKSDLLANFDEAVTDRNLKIKEIENWCKDLEDPLELYLDKYLLLGSSREESWVPLTMKNWRLFSTSAVQDLIPEQSIDNRPFRSAFYFTPSMNSASSTSVMLASRSAHDVLSLFHTDPMEEVCARLNAFQPERLTGFPSLIARLLQCSEKGILQIKPKTIVVSGERLSSQIREVITDTWNAGIIDLYAASESLYMGIKKPHEDIYKVYQDLNLIEVLDANHKMVETGERGRVFMTSLVNQTLPFIRYDMLDYATLGAKDSCAETLLSLDGKISDGLMVSTIGGGSLEIPVYVLNEINIPGLKQIQYIFHSSGHIEIQYTARGNIDQELQDYFRTLVGENFQTITRLDIDRVDLIANRSGSKFYNVIKPDEFDAQLISLGVQFYSQKPLKISRDDEVIVPEMPDESKLTLVQRFKQIVSMYGDCRAVIGSNEIYTFSTLNKYSDQIAKELIGRGFDKKQPVCILCGHQPVTIAMILGVLKTGGLFYYLDPNLPKIRNAKILTEIQPGIILTDINYEQYAQDIYTNREEILSIVCENYGTNYDYHDINISGDDPACLIYTSGTSGTPKGVILSHGTILSRISKASEDIQINPNDNLSLIQSIGVNAGIRDIFTALLNGASLSLYDIQEHGVNRLGNWINEQSITHLYLLPTIWRMFYEIDKEIAYPSVQIVRLGGEPVTQTDITNLSNKFNNKCLFINGYASTETGTICHYIMDHTSQFVGGRVPVGYPVKGSSIKIVDENQCVVNNTLGEIVVQGESLAFGYWDPHQKITVPFNGDYFSTGDLGYRINNNCYFLLGRKDRIIKIHGFRINLDEIEDVIKSINGIADAAVMQNRTEDGGDGVCVYYELQQNISITPDNIQRNLMPYLPGRRISFSYYQLSKIPRLSGGKINIIALLDLIIDPNQITPSSGTDSGLEEELLNETEKVLADIWRECINRNFIRRNDDFFDLGGDSIAVFRVLSRIEHHFKVNISVNEFYQFDTIQLMALLIDQVTTR